MSDWDNWLTQDPYAFEPEEEAEQFEPDPDADLHDEPDAVVDEYDR